MKFEVTEATTEAVVWILEIEADNEEEARKKYEKGEYEIIDEDDRKVTEREIIEIEKICENCGETETEHCRHNRLKCEIEDCELCRQYEIDMRENI